MFGINQKIAHSRNYIDQQIGGGFNMKMKSLGAPKTFKKMLICDWGISLTLPDLIFAMIFKPIDENY